MLSESDKDPFITSWPRPSFDDVIVVSSENSGIQRSSICHHLLHKADHRPDHNLYLKSCLPSCLLGSASLYWCLFQLHKYHCYLYSDTYILWFLGSYVMPNGESI